MGKRKGGEGACWEGAGKRRGRDATIVRKKIRGPLCIFFSNVLYRNNKNIFNGFFIFLVFHQTPDLVVVYKIFYFLL